MINVLPLIINKYIIHNYNNSIKYNKSIWLDVLKIGQL